LLKDGTVPDRRAGGARTGRIVRVSMVSLTNQEEVVTADGAQLRRGRLFDVAGVVGRCPVPVLVLGGPRAGDEAAELAAAVRAIIHEEGTE
jgi:DhnA family fructose-bisphosphate aldolase class Ia